MNNFFGQIRLFRNKLWYNIQSDQFLGKMLHFGANTISIQSSWSEFMQEVGRKQSCWNSHFTVDRSGIMFWSQRLQRPTKTWQAIMVRTEKFLVQKVDGQYIKQTIICCIKYTINKIIYLTLNDNSILHVKYTYCKFPFNFYLYTLYLNLYPVFLLCSDFDRNANMLQFLYWNSYLHQFVTVLENKYCSQMMG